MQDRFKFRAWNTKRNVFIYNVQDVGGSIKRCENEEAICYVYDTGWAGMRKSGRGAGISCKFKKVLG